MVVVNRFLSGCDRVLNRVRDPSSFSSLGNAVECSCQAVRVFCGARHELQHGFQGLAGEHSPDTNVKASAMETLLISAHVWILVGKILSLMQHLNVNKSCCRLVIWWYLYLIWLPNVVHVRRVQSAIVLVYYDWRLFINWLKWLRQDHRHY